MDTTNPTATIECYRHALARRQCSHLADTKTTKLLTSNQTFERQKLG